MSPEDTGSSDASRQPRKTPHEKLHPRFAYLLSLIGTGPKRFERLRALKARENHQAVEREQQARATARRLETEKDQKIRLRLADQLKRLQRFAPITSAVHFPPPAGAGTPPPGRPDEPYVSAFILSDASLQDLERFAAPDENQPQRLFVGSQAGDILTALIPLDLAVQVAELRAVRYIELSRPCFPTLDTAITDIGIDVLHATVPPVDGVVGTGVIVGVIDNTLDIYHEDFWGDDGKSRVLWLWDQSLTAATGGTRGAVPPVMSGFPTLGGATYGIEYSRDAITDEVSTSALYAKVAHQPSRDPIETAGGIPGDIRRAHGTQVAGCAVGNGKANEGVTTPTGAAPIYKGAAPGADLIFVAVAPSLGDVLPRERPLVAYTAIDKRSIADAFAYIFAKADLDSRKPACVVNLSYSDMQGAHDGTDLGEQFLDSLLLKPGRAITLSAGNWHNSYCHIKSSLALGGKVDLKLQFTPFPDAAGGPDILPTNNDDVEIWYSGEDRFTVEMSIPDATAATGVWKSGPLDPPTVPGTASSLEFPNPVTGANPPPGGIQIRIDSVYQDVRNGDNLISILFIVPPGQSIPTSAPWTITLTCTTFGDAGVFHGWIDVNNNSQWNVPPGTRDEITVGVPSTTSRAITVGNHDQTGPPPAIRTDSGRGPTRLDQIKPEIATIGTAVMAPSPLHQANAGDPVAAGQPTYKSGTGTSFSAPIVAGACALLFQCRGKELTWADLKLILKTSAGNPSAPGPMTEDAIKKFGYGYLQMALACSGTAPKVDVYVRDSASDTGDQPSGSADWASPDIELLDLGGTTIANPVYDPADPSTPNTIVRVTVHNRGTMDAVGTEVFLYWADPATSLPFPDAWNATSIHTGGAGAWVLGNRIVAPTIPFTAPGNQATVEFGFAPPEPGTSLRGDDHFCLLVRLEHMWDPSLLGTGGWAFITDRNNITLRNMNVQLFTASSGAPAPEGSEMIEPSPDPEDAGDAEMAFYVAGSPDEDSLVVYSDLKAGQVTLDVPVQALPWRDLALLEQHGPRLPYGVQNRNDWVVRERRELPRDEVRRRTDVVGARALVSEHGIASIVAADPPSSTAPQRRTALFVPHARIANGERMPCRIRVRDAVVQGEHRFVHVAQLSGGRRIGGVTLELRAGRPRATGGLGGDQ